MPKIKINRVTRYYGTRWIMNHDFCVGIKDTVVTCYSWRDCLEAALDHIEWHKSRQS